MRKTTFIYTLSCPKSGDIMYVGKSNDPKSRFYKHKQVKGSTTKNNWISKLKSENLSPILTIIDEVLIKDWKRMEKFYISKFRKLGCELTNSSSGGDGMSFGNQTSFDGQHAKKVIAIDKFGSYHKEFNSAKEAAAYINKHNISSALKGLTKKAGGYIWIYKDVYKNLSQEDLHKIVENANRNLSKGNGEKTRFKKNQNSWNKGKIGIKLKPNKNVHQYTMDDVFIKTWETAKEASIYITGDVTGEDNISKCARGDGKTAFKYKWLYKKL